MKAIIVIFILVLSTQVFSIERNKADSLINEIMTSFKSEIDQRLKELSVDLKIKSDWNDSSFNAYAFINELSANLVFKGGLLELSVNEFSAVVCHELGHLIAGGIMTESRSYSEGASDYFMTSKCLRRLLTRGIIPLVNSDQAINQKCIKTVKETKESAVCASSLSTSLNLAHLLYEDSTFSLETKSTDIALSTYLHYPDEKCRVEIFMNGALGLRPPRCWFHP